MEVVELRRRASGTPTSLGLRRTRSVRSSLRMIGSRWRSASAIEVKSPPPLTAAPSVQMLQVKEVQNPPVLTSKMVPQCPAEQPKDNSTRHRHSPSDVFKKIALFSRDKTKISKDPVVAKSRISLFKKPHDTATVPSAKGGMNDVVKQPAAVVGGSELPQKTLRNEVKKSKLSLLRSPKSDLGQIQKKFRTETKSGTEKSRQSLFQKENTGTNIPIFSRDTVGDKSRIPKTNNVNSGKTQVVQQKQTTESTNTVESVKPKKVPQEDVKIPKSVPKSTDLLASRPTDLELNQFKTRSLDANMSILPKKERRQRRRHSQDFHFPTTHLSDDLHPPKPHKVDDKRHKQRPLSQSKIPFHGSHSVDSEFKYSNFRRYQEQTPLLTRDEDDRYVIRSDDLYPPLNTPPLKRYEFELLKIIEDLSPSNNKTPSYESRSNSIPYFTSFKEPVQPKPNPVFQQPPRKATSLLGLSNPAFEHSPSSLRELPQQPEEKPFIENKIEEEAPIKFTNKGLAKATAILGIEDPSQVKYPTLERNEDSLARKQELLGKKFDHLGQFWQPATPQVGRKVKPFEAKVTGFTKKRPRRHSLWLGGGIIRSASDDDLDEGGMEFLVDGLNITTKTNRNKKLNKLNQINIHLHALFAAIEHGHIDRARTILESTDVDVNSVNSDGLSPLDVAVLNNNKQLAKMLVAFGAQEGNQFKSPESLGSHLKQLLSEAERKVEELGGEIVPLEDAANNNNNNNRSYSIHSNTSATMTGCSGGGEAATDKQLLLWERRAKGLKKMLLGFDQARPPDAPFMVAVDVTGTTSVTVRFQEPEQQDSAICTKFKVQWSTEEDFSTLTGEREILDMKQLECHVTDLIQGQRYFFRVSCGNLKGFGNFRPSSPASVVPSSWRDVEGREPRFEGRLQMLDELFDEIRTSRPEYAAEIKASVQSETPGVQRRNQRKKTTIKQLFTVASKFQKNLRRGVFLACLLYHEDKVLVTNEDFLPVIEVDETYPSFIYNDFHWLMKVACTWDDVKSLRQDMEKSLSSSTVHFRIKLLQAASQMQTALSIQDLGQLFHKPIRDSQGVLVLCTVNYIRSPKNISVLNSRWLPLSKVQKKLATHEEPNVGELLMASIQEQITYHQVSSIRLSKGLYLGYLKMRSSVDLLQVVVPAKTPNVLPHCKIRDNPHVSSEEWEWLRRQSSRQSSLTTLSSDALTEEEGSDQGTEQQRVFVELVAATAKRLCSFMDISHQEASSHRLYDAEVVDLSPEVSFLIACPPADSACAVPGQRELLLQRGDLFALPVQVFEMVHMGTYQRDVISRYSRLSCILELDTILAHHTHREAFSSSEVAAAKDRLAQLQEFQNQLNMAWKGARWLMDILTFARDKASVGISMQALLALHKEKEGSKNSINNSGSLKRSLLQLPPRDPKVVKSNSSRGSWPGPGVNPGSVVCLLATELSKSEQHLVTRKNSGTSSISNCSSQMHGVDAMTAANSNGSLTTLNTRLPPSRSEDTLHQRPVKTHGRSRSSTTSVSASSSPLLQARPLYSGSLLSVARSMHSLSSEESSSAAAIKDVEEEEDSAVVPAPGPGILQVYAAYETGLASGTSLKLHVTPRTTVREVVDLVVKQLNMAVVLKGKDGPIYPSEKLHNFCLVAIIGARERCLRDDFKPLQLQNPWKKGRLYVRQKHDVLAALEQSSRHSAFL